MIKSVFINLALAYAEATYNWKDRNLILCLIEEDWEDGMDLSYKDYIDEIQKDYQVEDDLEGYFEECLWNNN